MLLVDDKVEVVEMVRGCACFSRASFGRIPSNSAVITNLSPALQKYAKSALRVELACGHPKLRQIWLFMRKDGKKPVK